MANALTSLKFTDSRIVTWTPVHSVSERKALLGVLHDVHLHFAIARDLRKVLAKLQDTRMDMTRHDSSIIGP